MKAKGTTLMVFKEFIEKNYGPDDYKRWVDSLPSEEAKAAFTGVISTPAWYSAKEYLIDPTIKIAELFYGGNVHKAAEEIGKASAEFALRGIYKFFVKIGSPTFVIKKAGSIMPTYYQGSEMEVAYVEKGRAALKIIKCEDLHEVVEMRIFGWIEKAIEISGGNNVKVTIASSLLNGDSSTAYEIRWE